MYFFYLQYTILIVIISLFSGFIVEHDFIMATYLADRVIVFEGTPSINTKACAPQSLLTGMNKFLEQLQITFRRDPSNFRLVFSILHILRSIIRSKSGAILFLKSEKVERKFWFSHPFVFVNTVYDKSDHCLPGRNGWNFCISGLKMMVKSGLEKILMKFLHGLTMSFLLLNLYFWSKLPLSMRKIHLIEFFLDHFSPSFLGQKC